MAGSFMESPARKSDASKAPTDFRRFLIITFTHAWHVSIEHIRYTFAASLGRQMNDFFFFSPSCVLCVV